MLQNLTILQYQYIAYSELKSKQKFVYYLAKWISTQQKPFARHTWLNHICFNPSSLQQSLDIVSSQYNCDSINVSVQDHDRIFTLQAIFILDLGAFLYHKSILLCYVMCSTSYLVY